MYVSQKALRKSKNDVIFRPLCVVRVDGESWLQLQPCTTLMAALWAQRGSLNTVRAREAFTAGYSLRVTTSTQLKTSSAGQHAGLIDLGQRRDILRSNTGINACTGAHAHAQTLSWGRRDRWTHRRGQVVFYCMSKRLVQICICKCIN